MPPTDHARVTVAHQLPTRTRLRIAPSRLPDGAAAAIVAAAGALPGVRQVIVDRRAASVLCAHDPGVSTAALVAATAQALAATPPAAAPSSAPRAVAREIARVFHGLDRDVLATTGGRVDLGTLATFGFLGAGALDVAVKGRLPIPPWFNLAWWGFRTFLTFEGGAIAATRDGRDAAT